MAAASSASRRTVLVTGAGGKTGKLIAQKVKRSEKYSLRALFRTEKSKDKCQKELGLSDAECVVADVTSNSLSSAMTSCDSMIVATSATPQINYWLLPSFLFQRFILQQKVMPSFTFPQVPEEVDWQGQKAQFDAAKEAGVKHVVLVSSMGGTKPDSTLNKIGDGNILVWKRKAEKYLMDSGLAYTIFHPGGLSNSEGGQAPIKLDVDDKLMDGKSRRIPRADVAELCVQALGAEAAKNRSVDCVVDAEASEGAKAPSSPEDFAALFQGMAQNCDYSICPPQ